MKPLPSPPAATVFLCLALVFGSVFVVLVPPFQSPDEPGHLLRAYQVSEGAFFPESADRRLGGVLPLSLSQVRDSFVFLKMNYAARLEKNTVSRCLAIPLRAQQRDFTDFPNTAIYAPTAYLPQAAAILLLRPFDVSPLLLLYAARLANLLVWVLLVWAAIRQMPFLKEVMAALALLPASLVVAATANADVFTNGLCWWLIAAFCTGKIPGLKNLAALAAVCANKLIALPLVLLAFPGHWRAQLPLRRFGLFAAVALLAALAWGNLAQRWFIPYDAYNPAFRDAQTLNEGVDPARQQAFMLKNPLFFAKTAVTSALKALPSTAAHLVGKFGWEKNYLPPLWLALLWLALAALLASENNPLPAWQRRLAAGVVAAYAALFASTMYALWCPVGAHEITNFQGRYFVPVLPVAALAVAGGWLGKWKREIWLMGIAVSVLANLAMVWSIWERYCEK